MSSESNIPIIDMGPYLEGTEAGRQKVAQEIYQAAHEVGFTYLKNFGKLIKIRNLYLKKNGQFVMKVK